jgi:hypothetical protein
MFFSRASFQPLDSAAFRNGEEDLVTTSVWTVKRGPSVPVLIVMVSVKTNLFYLSVIVEQDPRRKYVPVAFHGG